MTTDNLPLGSTIDEVLNREATRRPQSRFAAGALETQVGGNHYVDLAIQPIEFSMANKLNACQHSAIKYIVRKKGNQAKRLEDIDKAIHFLCIYREMIQKGEAE